MRGEIVVTHGVNGWGNRKVGCEAYGPGGRWDGPTREGDLLGDHLESLGCTEGSPLIVIASSSRFDKDEFDRLRDAVAEFVAGWAQNAT